MMYVNLIWVWGHPEVYILVLPAFGIYSEVTATFCRKPLFGYSSMVYATDLHHHPQLHRLAAPLLHHGRRRIGELLLRHRLDDHLDPDRRQALQLALHHVPRPHPLRAADDVDRRLHADLRHRRHDRRHARGAARRLRPAQLALPRGALPQRHHRRRALRPLRRHLLLVAEGLRLPARALLGQGLLLVLGLGLLGRLHAALRPRPDGRHPPHARLRRPVLADLVPDRRPRRRPDRHRHRRLPRPDRPLDLEARRACAT